MVDAGSSIENVNPRARIPVIPETGASRTLELTEGSFDLVVTDEASKDVRVGPIGIDLMGGGLYTVYLS
ncbi:MAG: hypothetical protein U5O39_16840 [Gammaproteobacteria bacterium]|nr:hypothetical protein [Gammaproteobacteria bacterium]